jgi:hypothetical protein
MDNEFWALCAERFVVRLSRKDVFFGAGLHTRRRFFNAGKKSP